MRVLSLFDGMSCGRISLDNLGVDCEYYASEVDKFATKVSEANYPDIIRLGDVTKWKEWDIDWNFDLLLGGSPCQGFSFAGKQLAFDDPRSALFFEYVDILNHVKTVNPNVKFLLENVRMKKEFIQVINDYLGVDPIVINSSLLSAQNRIRYYWCNWDVKQPEDKGILLKDVIEGEVDSEFYYSQKSIAYMERGNDKWMQAGSRRADRYTQTEDSEKSFTLTANMHKGVPYNYFKEKVAPCNQFKAERDKSQTILSTIYKENVKSMIKRNKKGLYLKKSLCNQVGIASDIRGNESIKRIYGTDGKCPCLTTMGGGHREPKIALDKTQYRKLTPLECERLQTVPDNYTNHVSNTQRYKMLGNGWTVDVISHILKGAL